VDVRVSLEFCPQCGNKLQEQRVDFAYITELPPLPRPRVTQYRVWVCRCTACGRQVRGKHADLAADQYGATAHRVGPRAMAAAHVLHYQVGIPVRKVPLVVDLLTGMKLTQGAVTQDALRRARGAVGAAYQELRHSVRDSPAVYTDDTGWKVGGENAHLMAFDTAQTTVYQVRPRRRHQEVQEIIPRNYSGVMVTDRAAATRPAPSGGSSSRNVWPTSRRPLAPCWRRRGPGPGRLGRSSRCGSRWPWTCGRNTTVEW